MNGDVLAGGRPTRGRLRAVHCTFWTGLLVVTMTDVATKYLAHTRLTENGVPREVMGPWFRITLAYNPGAAFGLNVGAASRWVFLALTAAACIVLFRLYRATRPGAVLRALALGLVAGGALGNLINRIWSARGVVDFLDVGVGSTRWPTFNVADVGVSLGAALLAVVLSRDDRQRARV